MIVVSLFFASCSFFSDGDLTPAVALVTELKLSKQKFDIKVGSIDYIEVTYKPELAVYLPTFTYDENKIEVTVQPNGLVIKGLEEGQTELTVASGFASATCIITVSGYEQGYEKVVEPYLYSNTNIIQLSPGMSEKVYASLYGGDASDINNYTWTVDDSNVCSISPSGQYCLIKGVSEGYTRVKITHTKSAYPYYMGVYVYNDPSKATYITTSDNIITMNQDDAERTVTVSLVNGLESSQDSSFSWQVINEGNSEIPVTVNCNGNKAVVTPKKSGVSGTCTIRVTHPDATYPLDILCRIITIVKNVYIEPDLSIVNLNGAKEESLTSKLMNINVSEYSQNDFTYEVLNTDVASIVESIGNVVYLKGLKNGSTKLVVSHPKSAYTREVLLISSGQLVDAIDASCYITTSDNYIRTKVGNTPSEVNISLRGGREGDENNFTWTVRSSAADGSNTDVIALDTPTGEVVSTRAAAQVFSYGKAFITPLKEGTAVIEITHPKILYPTEILVKVLPETAILDEPLYFKGDGLVRVLNGTSCDYTVSLNGNSKKPTDNQSIKWSIDDARLSVVGNEDKAKINAPSLGVGSTISHLSISHPKVEYPKSVVVLTADDEVTLMNMKALYTDKNYYNLEVGRTITFNCETVGFEATDENGNYVPYDFSLFNWSVERTGIIDIQVFDLDKRVVSVTALKAGTTKLTASFEGYECVFTITVYPVGAMQIDPEIYFTTTQNVVCLNPGTASIVKVSAINMSSLLCSEIEWRNSDDSVCSVVGNGTSATITAIKDGESVISVYHSQSQNTLKIYVRVGSEYVMKNATPIYISAQDVITMLRDDGAQKIQAVLVNYNGNDGDHFDFTIDNTSVAKISAKSNNGIAYVSPVGSGQAEVTITNTLTELTKKVLIIVGNSAEELAGLTYLTTSNNVVSIGQGKTRTVSVNVINSEDIVLDGYSWTSSDYSIADVVSNGSTASIRANSIGTAIITVRNSSCKYPLEIIVHVVDPITATAHPYIQLSSSVLLQQVDNTYSSITAELVGGTDADKSSFVWDTNDSSICTVYGQNDVGKIKAVKEGTTYVTVSHPKADYSAQLLVVCEKKSESECYISVPSSIINMKPTDDSTSITASLINGDVNDKYNFKWSLDVYDIIDFQYSANVCTIKPKQSGTTTITISHPKADYDQQIIVNVQEYSTFSFPSTNITLTQGEVKFVNMQVPNTSVKTHIEYFVKNEKICSISGTKQVAQITGIGSGSTTVTAKLIATNTGSEQASSDMMVYVKEREVTDAYITSTSTIYTINKGKSQTLTATITGTDITSSDQADLKWSTSDSDIVEVTGLNTSGFVRGKSIYVTAKQAGEAIITCSHEKASSVLEFYVVVPGSDKKIVTLDKSYITVIKGSSGSALTANIENAESNDDYNKLQWSCIGGNGVDGSSIARIMGSGKNVQIYPISPGEVTVYAQLPDSDSVGQCTVIVQAGKSFTLENSGVKVAPCQTKTLNYKVSPYNAIITWIRNSEDDYFDYKDLGCDENGNGKVEITGLKEGQGLLMASTDGGATGRLIIKCGWSYLFNIKGTTSFSITPADTLSYDYTVSPPDAEITVESPYSDYFIYSVDQRGSDESVETSGSSYGTITITPTKECGDKMEITIRAKNKYNDEVVGEKVIRGFCKYGKLPAQITADSRTRGRWSSLNNGVLTLGDGEEYSLQVGIKGSGYNGHIEKVEFKCNDTSLSSIISQTSTSVGNDQCLFKISHGTDMIDQRKGYTINHLYVDPSYPSWDDMMSYGWYSAMLVHQKGQSNEFTYKNGMLRLFKPDGIICHMGYYADDYIGCVGSDSYSVGNDLVNKDKDGNFIKTENLKEATDWRGRFITTSELKNNPWLYCPGTVVSDNMAVFKVNWSDIENGTYKNGKYGDPLCLVEPHIIGSHVDATEDTWTSSDDTVRESRQIGTIEIIIIHNGKTEKADLTIPVYLETRNCPCQ